MNNKHIMGIGDGGAKVKKGLNLKHASKQINKQILPS